MQKKKRATPKTLQASISVWNINVYDSRIRKRLIKYDLFEGVSRRHPGH